MKMLLKVIWYEIIPIIILCFGFIGLLVFFSFLNEFEPGVLFMIVSASMICWIGGLCLLYDNPFSLALDYTEGDDDDE